MILPECFDQFRESAFRMETLPWYMDDAERFAAFREGRPLPERSVRTSPWLRRIAETAAAGKRWSRVYLVDNQKPLPEHTRFKLVAYAESATAGENIWITDRSADPALGRLRTDFWLFDAESDHRFAAIMEYGPGGRYLSAQITTEVRACIAARDLAFRHSVPLNAYLKTAAA
jgi:hypothetical protein